MEKQSKAVETKFKSSEPDQIPVTNGDNLLELVEAAIEEIPLNEAVINGTDIERDYYKNKRDIDKYQAEITMYKKLSESKISNEGTQYLVFNTDVGSWTLNNEERIPEEFRSKLNELKSSLNTKISPSDDPAERTALHVDPMLGGLGNWKKQYPFLNNDGHAGLLALAVDNLVNTFNDEDQYKVALDNFNAVYNALCVPAYSHGADPNSRKKQALEKFKQAVFGELIEDGLESPAVETTPETNVESELQQGSDSINADDDFNLLRGKGEFYRVKEVGDLILENSNTTNKRWTALTEQVKGLIESDPVAAIALGTKLKSVKKPILFLWNVPLLKPLTDAVLETLKELTPSDSSSYKAIALKILFDQCNSQVFGLPTVLVDLYGKVDQIKDVKEICEIAQQVAGLRRPFFLNSYVAPIIEYADRVIERETIERDENAQDPDLKKLIQEVKWISLNRFKDTSTWGGHAKRHTQLCEHLDKIHSVVMTDNDGAKSQLKNMLNHIISQKDDTLNTTSKIQAHLNESHNKDGSLKATPEVNNL